MSHRSRPIDWYWQRLPDVMRLDAADLDTLLGQVGWKFGDLLCQRKRRESRVLSLKAPGDGHNGARHARIFVDVPVGMVLGPDRQNAKFVPIDFDTHILIGGAGNAAAATCGAAWFPRHFIVGKASAAVNAPHGFFAICHRQRIADEGTGRHPYG